MAKWYALDKPAEVAFDTSSGGEEDLWQKRRANASRPSDLL